jgi:hypothetical protein
MTLKNINLKVPEAEHARMTAVAESEFIPLTSLLRRLFAQYEQARTSQHPARAQPKLNKRDQAFEEYHTLMDSLPETWSESEYRRVRSTIEGLRVAGGNIAHIEMPMPRAMVDWKNSTASGGLDPKYAKWTLEQLRTEVQTNYNQSARHFLTIKEQEAELGMSFDE